MEKLFSILLILHIISGGTGLITGTINLVQKKGGKRHRKVGILFVIAMLSSSISALILSAIHPNYFLFMVGIFTFYMVGTGYRYIHLKMLGKNNEPDLLDWTLSGLMAICGIFLFLLGVYQLFQSNSFGWVFITFGTIGLLFVKQDWANYHAQAKFKNYWLLAHISRMTGGYIASLTAFLVVNMKYSPFALPPVLVWLFPSIILVPLIIRWSNKRAVKIK